MSKIRKKPNFVSPFFISRRLENRNLFHFEFEFNKEQKENCLNLD